MFEEMKGIGYRDIVDPALQGRAATWYAFDLVVCGLGLVADIVLLTALARPVCRLTQCWHFRVTGIESDRVTRS